MPTYMQLSREKYDILRGTGISFVCLSSVFSGYHCRKHLPPLLVLYLLLLFYGMGSAVAILHSDSDHLLLLYYSATYFYIFYMLLLYPVTLPNSFILIVFWENI